MNVNHLDAAAITQPGGLYASANQGILDALKAYFAFRDRQAQGERELKRDERTNRRAQRFDAISLAREVGARPGPEASGWLDPADNPAIDSVLADRAKRIALADKDRAQADAMAQLGLRAKRMVAARAGAQLPDDPTDLLGDGAVFEDQARTEGAEQRRLQLEAMRRSLLPKPAPQLPERSGWQAIKGRDGQAWLLNRATGEMRPAVPGADRLNAGRAPGASVPAGSPAQVSIPHAASQPAQHAQPSVSVGGVDLTPPSAQHDPAPLYRSLADAGIDHTGSFGQLMPALVGADPAARAQALGAMPAMWRKRAIVALRAAGLE